MAKLDQPGMPGIRHVTDLADFRRLQRRKNLVAPIVRFRCCRG
jgi:hypothetical protein